MWDPLLPQQFPPSKPSAEKSGRSQLEILGIVTCATALAWVLLLLSGSGNASRVEDHLFYANITSPKNICPVVEGPGISYSGYIGLRGDTDSAPRRSFFRYSEAENDAATAPIILTIGGGPGASGMLGPILAQGPCLVAENGTVPNPNRWTEHSNLLALDHPIGAGFSYGTYVNNSRDAAIDVYDFLQKFFRLFPHLAKNQFVLSGGSYGGIYVPHIATVIHEQNLALAAGKGQPGAIHINLESMMLSNPLSDATSYFTWMLQARCYNFDMYNSSTCAEMFEILPRCLDSIRLAEQDPIWSVEKRGASLDLCWQLVLGDTHGTAIEDVRKKCAAKDPIDCLPPAYGWTDDFFHRADIKDALGVPDHVNFSIVNMDVNVEFRAYGDPMQAPYLLYTPLLKAGIRLLHYIGAKDANCAWPGVISFLKLLPSQFQEEFNNSPDVPWPTAEEATVRVVGNGAGNMTYILIAEAGHFVARDQPVLTKSIVDHWVPNVAFISN
ncbi:alpha/beta-hydrolase [Mycena rebaudengoi]|nr:alpha/beta-hydrolase [Mycena rebaudengoi]